MAVLRVDHPTSKNSSPARPTRTRSPTSYSVGSPMPSCRPSATIRLEPALPDLPIPRQRLQGHLRTAEAIGIPSEIQDYPCPRPLREDRQTGHHNGEPGVLFLDAPTAPTLSPTCIPSKPPILRGAVAWPLRELLPRFGEPGQHLGPDHAVDWSACMIRCNWPPASWMMSWMPMPTFRPCRNSAKPLCAPGASDWASWAR